MKLFLNLVIFFFKKANTFYIQLLYKTRFFVNNVMCGYNLFLKLLTDGLSSIYFERSIEEANISKFITFIRKKTIQDFSNIKKNVILSRTY